MTGLVGFPLSNIFEKIRIRPIFPVKNLGEKARAFSGIGCYPEERTKKGNLKLFQLSFQNMHVVDKWHTAHVVRFNVHYKLQNYKLLSFGRSTKWGSDAFSYEKPCMQADDVAVSDEFV